MNSLAFGTTKWYGGFESSLSAVPTAPFIVSQILPQALGTNVSKQSSNPAGGLIAELGQDEDDGTGSIDDDLEGEVDGTGSVGDDVGPLGCAISFSIFFV